LSKQLAIAIIIVIVLIVSTTIYYLCIRENSSSNSLVIFTAGSLKIPLDNIASKYEELYGVKVYIEASGSVEAIRKIIDLNRKADVLAVADYRLIPKYMIPKYASWYIGFASNEIVLVYTDKSKYHEELEHNTMLWYEVLMRRDVKWGFSDPNKDPCGYRTVGLLGLASISYNNTNILELLINNTNIGVKWERDKLVLSVPANLEVKQGSNLDIKPKSVDLISLVEAGIIDYAFEYRSVAIQHKLKYIELPRQINLGDPKYTMFYERVIVKILTGTDKEAEISMYPIIYGLTIPSNAPHKDEAIRFVKFMLGDTGRKIFEENGQRFPDKFIVYGNVPEEISSLANK
jgi:molybdate/tungstate transport system substrate-binding protein